MMYRRIPRPLEQPSPRPHKVAAAHRLADILWMTNEWIDTVAWRIELVQREHRSAQKRAGNALSHADRKTASVEFCRARILRNEELRLQRKKDAAVQTSSICQWKLKDLTRGAACDRTRGASKRST